MKAPHLNNVITFIKIHNGNVYSFNMDTQLWKENSWLWTLNMTHGLFQTFSRLNAWKRHLLEVKLYSIAQKHKSIKFKFIDRSICLQYKNLYQLIQKGVFGQLHVQTMYMPVWTCFMIVFSKEYPILAKIQLKML